MNTASNPARTTMDELAVDELAAELHLILGDLVDDLTFAALVDDIFASAR
jgi:hypothetical protein